MQAEGKGSPQFINKKRFYYFVIVNCTLTILEFWLEQFASVHEFGIGKSENLQYNSVLLW